MHRVGRRYIYIYIKIQSVPRSKHYASIIQTSQLLLYREIIAVCSEIHTKTYKCTVWAEGIYIKRFSPYRAVNTLRLGYTNQSFMLCREIIAVCFQIHRKHINTVCGQNVELYINTQSVPRSKHTLSRLYKPVL